MERRLPTLALMPVKVALRERDLGCPARYYSPRPNWVGHARFSILLFNCPRARADKSPPRPWAARPKSRCPRHLRRPRPPYVRFCPGKTPADVLRAIDPRFAADPAARSAGAPAAEGATAAEAPAQPSARVDGNNRDLLRLFQRIYSKWDPLINSSTCCAGFSGRRCSRSSPC